jgi:hypothetical protein
MKKRLYEIENARFVRTEQGSGLVNMGKNSFLRLSREAGATVKYGRVSLHDMEKIYNFLELLEG